MAGTADVQGLVEEVMEFVRLQWGAARGRDDRQVEVAGRQPFQQYGGEAFLAGHVDAWVAGAEGGQRLWHQPGVGRGESTEPPPPTGDLAQGGEFAHDAVERVGHGLGMRHERPVRPR